MNALYAVLQRPRAGAGGSSRLLQLFSSSVVDQIILSAGNFFVGFMLIRRTSDTDYGMYVLVQSTVLLLTTAQQSIVSGPLAVLAPKRTPEDRRLMMGAVARSWSRVILIAAAVSLLIPLVGYWVGYFKPLEAVVAGIGVFACAAAMPREYRRSALLIYSRPNDVLRADIFYILILASGAVLAAFGPPPAVVWAVAALVLAALVSSMHSGRSLGRDPGWVDGDSRAFWREMAPLGLWSGLGAVIYWSFGQSYNYILAGRLSLTAVADVNAARLMLMPAVVVATGVKALLIPSAAFWLEQSGMRALLRRLYVFALGLAVLDLGYFAFVAIFRDWMTHDFLHKTIGDRDVLLALWACIALTALVRDVLQCALIALGSFKPMAWLTGLSAIICLLITWFGLVPLGPRAAMIGVLSGEIVNLLGVILLIRHFRRQHPG